MQVLHLQDRHFSFLPNEFAGFFSATLNNVIRLKQNGFVNEKEYV